jgi:peptide/nickel transport system permease protein
VSITPDNPVEGGEKQRQARIAQSDALTPAGALRTNFQGDLEGGFLGAEQAEEHDEVTAVAARGYWEGIWLRLRKDKLAIAGAIFIVFLFIVAFAGAPLAQHYLGHGPNDINPIPGPGGGITDELLPVGPWSWVNHFQDDGTIEKQLYILGSDGTTGRDEFLRLLYGAQVSLEVGVGATMIAMFLGLILGSIAGFFRGWIDTVISRVTEITMAFPYLLFVIALASTVGTRLNKITFGFLSQGAFTLIIVFGIFSWFYSARVFRGITLSLREKEFVEAARMIGASDMRIVRSHIFPHLVGPLIVFSTLNVAAFIVAEAGLSFLGLGIPLPTASWGNLLAVAPDFYLTRPLLLLWPGLALVCTTLAFNLLGDGLRDAFDPRSQR